jgi:hypothetical protein
LTAIDDIIGKRKSYGKSLFTGSPPVLALLRKVKDHIMAKDSDWNFMYYLYYFLRPLHDGSLIIMA